MLQQAINAIVEENAAKLETKETKEEVKQEKKEHKETAKNICKKLRQKRCQRRKSFIARLRDRTIRI